MIMLRVRFIKNGEVDKKVVYPVGIHDLPPEKAYRWVKRGIAEILGPVEVLDKKVEPKAKEVVSETIVESKSVEAEVENQDVEVFEDFEVDKKKTKSKKSKHFDEVEL